MQLLIQPEEANLLKEILGNYLTDLRMEIADTEDYDLRQQLKNDEATIKGLLDRLEHLSLAAA